MQFNPNSFKLNPKYADQWFKLSGAINAEDYGGLFIQSDAYCSNVVKYDRGDDDGDNYGHDHEGNPYRFYFAEHGFDMPDLNDNFLDYSTFAGINDAYYEDNEGSSFVCDCLTAATEYGFGMNDSRCLTEFSHVVNSMGLTEFPSEWIPKDYFVPVD